MDETSKFTEVKSLEAKRWRNPDDIDSLNNKIISILSNILLENPQNAIALINLGAIYSDLGRYKEALEKLKVAEKLNFEDHNLYRNIAIVFVYLREEDKAKKYFALSSRFIPNKYTFEAYFDPHAH